MNIQPHEPTNFKSIPPTITEDSWNWTLAANQAQIEELLITSGEKFLIWKLRENFPKDLRVAKEVTIKLAAAINKLYKNDKHHYLARDLIPHLFKFIDILKINKLLNMENLPSMLL